MIWRISGTVVELQTTDPEVAGPNTIWDEILSRPSLSKNRRRLWFETKTGGTTC